MLELISSQNILTFRHIGRSLIGLSCEDVADISLKSLLDLALKIDLEIGDDISPDLVICYLFYQLFYLPNEI